MLAAGLRAAVPASTRTFVWVTSATATSALLREQLQLGLRYHDSSDDDTWRSTLTCAAGGAFAGVISLFRLRLGSARRSAMLAGCAGLGIVLPAILASAGPIVRRQFGTS